MNMPQPEKKSLRGQSGLITGNFRLVPRLPSLNVDLDESARNTKTEPIMASSIVIAGTWRALWCFTFAAYEPVVVSAVCSREERPLLSL